MKESIILGAFTSEIFINLTPQLFQTNQMETNKKYFTTAQVEKFDILENFLLGERESQCERERLFEAFKYGNEVYIYDIRVTFTSDVCVCCEKIVWII